MNLAVMMLFVGLSGGVSLADLSADRLVHADSLYQEALKSSGTDREILAQRAAALFEEAVSKGGRWNGHLLYNLATSYHLSGDLGRAILNYRRAQQLLPGFADLEANLGVALKQRKDKIEPGQKEEILRGLFFWHYVLAPATRRRAFVICFIAVWFFLGLNTLRSSGAAKALVAIVAVLSLALGLSVATDLLSMQRGNRGVLVAEEILARKGPGSSYAPAYEGGLHAGTEVRVIEHDRSWFRVQLLDGSQCWLPEGSFDVF